MTEAVSERSDMIERVARAIAFENDWLGWDDMPENKQAWNAASGMFGMTLPSGAFCEMARDVNEPYKQDYRAMARAAIAAMREPTEEMLLVLWPPDVRGPDTNDFKGAILEYWQAMIDECLKEAPEGSLQSSTPVLKPAKA